MQCINIVIVSSFYFSCSLFFILCYAICASNRSPQCYLRERVNAELLLTDYSVRAKQKPSYLHREQEKSYMKLYKANTNNTSTTKRQTEKWLYSRSTRKYDGYSNETRLWHCFSRIQLRCIYEMKTLDKAS